VSELISGRPGVFAVPSKDADAIAAALRAIHLGEGADGVSETRDWLRRSLTFDRHAEAAADLFETVMTEATR
jgi:hypothetical protein